MVTPREKWLLKRDSSGEVEILKWESGRKIKDDGTVNMYSSAAAGLLE